ncbi:hypothetical protein Tco_0591018 [Tanacetum coccineum]
MVSQPPGFLDPKYLRKVSKWLSSVMGYIKLPEQDNDSMLEQILTRKSTTVSEYVAATSCCGQVLWDQNQMLDYGFNFMNTKIYIDNESTICIVKNPVYHSKTKHIAIRHHFIRDAYEKKLIQSLPDSTSAQSEVPFEQQPDPSPNPSPRPSPKPLPTPIVTDSIPEPTGENLGDHSSNDTSLSGNEDDMTLQNVYDFVYLYVNRVHKVSGIQQGGRLQMENHQFKRSLFDVMLKIIDHMKQKNALKVKALRKCEMLRYLTRKMELSTRFEKSLVLTDQSLVLTDSKVSIDEHNEGTMSKMNWYKESLKVLKSKRATLLLNMRSDKLLLKKKRERCRVERIVEEIDRPRPTSTRSLLTLKPLPKIDPKDKGKKKIEEEDESESEDDDIPQAVKKFKQLESDEEMARKIQEEWEEMRKKTRLIKRMNKKGFLKGEEFNKNQAGTLKKKVKVKRIKEKRINKKEKARILKNKTEEVRGLECWLTTNNKGIKSTKLNRHTMGLFTSNGLSWLVQDQTVLGNDYSNLLIADSLLKTIWFINALCYDNEALASPNTNDEELSIPEQTATGKGTSNPLMAGSLPKTTKPT